MSSGPFSHDAAQVTFLFSLNQSNVITDQKQQFLICKFLENCHSLHLCFRQLWIDWKTWYKCQARKTLFKWCQRTVEASSMATMEMGKASALLNSRIVFKLFHSNSNYNLHFFLYFLGLQMKHVERMKNSLKMLTNKSHISCIIWDINSNWL